LGASFHNCNLLRGGELKLLAGVEKVGARELPGVELVNFRPAEAVAQVPRGDRPQAVAILNGIQASGSRLRNRLWCGSGLRLGCGSRFRLWFGNRLGNGRLFRRGLLGLCGDGDAALSLGVGVIRADRAAELLGYVGCPT